MLTFQSAPFFCFGFPYCQLNVQNSPSFQLRALTIAKWWVDTNGTNRRPRSFTPLPQGKHVQLERGSEIPVCVLGIGGCVCGLVLAYENGDIKVPENLTKVAELASASETEGLQPDSFREKYLKEFYPSCVQGKQKEVC